MFDLEVMVFDGDAAQTAKQKAAAKANLKKARAARGDKVVTRSATGAKTTRAMTARGKKISKALRGKRRGPHSAARKKAISAGMRRYWRSKRASWRRKGATKRAKNHARKTGKHGNARRVAANRYLSKKRGR